MITPAAGLKCALGLGLGRRKGGRAEPKGLVRGNWNNPSKGRQNLGPG